VWPPGGLPAQHCSNRVWTGLMPLQRSWQSPHQDGCVFGGVDEDDNSRLWKHWQYVTSYWIKRPVWYQGRTLCSLPWYLLRQFGWWGQLQSPADQLCWWQWTPFWLPEVWDGGCYSTWECPGCRVLHPQKYLFLCEMSWLIYILCCPCVRTYQYLGNRMLSFFIAGLSNSVKQGLFVIQIENLCIGPVMFMHCFHFRCPCLVKDRHWSYSITTGNFSDYWQPYETATYITAGLAY
jgi:hypothetical protein